MLWQISPRNSRMTIHNISNLYIFIPAQSALQVPILILIFLLPGSQDPHPTYMPIRTQEAYHKCGNTSWCSRKIESASFLAYTFQTLK